MPKLPDNQVDQAALLAVSASYFTSWPALYSGRLFAGEGEGQGVS